MSTRNESPQAGLTRAGQSADRRWLT